MVLRIQLSGSYSVVYCAAKNRQCISTVDLAGYHINDEQALCLSHDLSKLSELTWLDLCLNDTGAWAVYSWGSGGTESEGGVFISSEGQETLQKFTSTKAEWLWI